MGQKLNFLFDRLRKRSPERGSGWAEATQQAKGTAGSQPKPSFPSMSHWVMGSVGASDRTEARNSDVPNPRGRPASLRLERRLSVVGDRQPPSWQDSRVGRPKRFLLLFLHSCFHSFG